MGIMKNRKPLSFILSLCMLFAMTPITAFADMAPASAIQTEAQADLETQITETIGTAFRDLSGHWASAAVSKWAGLGVVKGDDRGFRPDASITRAEMAVILNNLMGYQIEGKNSFTDVNRNAWYAEAILKANAAGILHGDGAGHANPTSNISREQAAVMLARALGVDESDGAKTYFKDAGDISPWAENLVYGMEEDKYIGGMGSGNFSPKSDITRAQVVTMIDNAVAGYYKAAETYTENLTPKTSGGNCVVIVKVPGVIIKGANIDGDLIIAEGVAEGEFTLDSSTISGKMIARGGGSDSIHFINGADVNGDITVEKVGGKIRIVSNGKVIKELEADTEVILEGSFSNITVAEGASVEVRGQAETVTVQAKADVTISKDAKVETLFVDKAAESTKIEVSGTVTNLKTEAPKTEIVAKSTANISSVVAASTAEGTNLDMDKKATINTFTCDTTATLLGGGAPKTINGSGIVEEKVKDDVGGGGGGGGGEKDDQTAPSGLVGLAPTSTANNDGIITGVNSSMEYKLLSSSTYLSISGTEVTGLAAGIYHIRLKEDAEHYPSSDVVVEIPEFSTVYDFAIVKGFAEKTGFDPAKAKLFTADGATKTYDISEHLDVDVLRGQIVAFGLNKDEDIGAMCSDDAISVDSGLTILSPTALDINGELYDIWEQVSVFTYDGSAPDASDCNYEVYTIDNIDYGNIISSPASVYLDVGGVIAILVPKSAINVFKPTGLNGIAPTSDDYDDGKITGVNSSMEYRSALSTTYHAITGTAVTDLAAGTYHVRYKATGGDPAGPDVTVIVPAYVAANQYGLVKAFQIDAFGAKVKMLKANDETRTYYLSDLLDVEAEKGQLVAFGLNDDGDIGAMDSTNEAISVDTGLDILSSSSLSYGGITYVISDSIVVFTYDGADPGDAVNYGTAGIGDVVNKSFTSPARVYFNKEGKVTAILIPKLIH